MHTLFKEQADGIKNHVPESLFIIVEGLEHLREMDLREKWEDPDFTEESRSHMWQYVVALKTYADLYAAVPQKCHGEN